MTISEVSGFLRALARDIGITRIADITGLDVLGLPVVQCVRPASRSNIVSQGKGATLGDAAASAVFEAAESFFAERLESFECISATARQLGIDGNRYRQHLRSDVAADWEDVEIPWVSSRNLMTGAAGYVPLALVHTCFTIPAAPDGGLFTGTTTGLAAGREKNLALTHALLECIERDALANAHGMHGFFHRARIDVATIADPTIRDLIDGLSEKGVLTGLWLAPSSTNIPVIWCHLLEDGDPSLALLPLPAEGSAARGDPVRAVRDAIFEAAQSRLTAISGARDDFTRASYPLYPDAALIAAHQRLLREGPCPVDFRAIEPRENTSGAVLDRLAAAGLDDVEVVDINSDPVPGIHVLKAFVPGLAPLFEGAP